MSLFPERGDLDEGFNRQRNCEAGFPHPMLEYLVGGRVNTRTGIAKMRYRCLVCGVIVEFQTLTAVEARS